MSAKLKRIIVFTMGDIESKGYDEQTLPTLLKIVDSSSPDNRKFINNDVIAYYLSSPHALASIEKVIVQAETLRNSDSRFTALGIGLSEGELIVEIDWLGRLKAEGSIASGLAKAFQVQRQPQKYREILQKLRDKIL